MLRPIVPCIMSPLVWARPIPGGAFCHLHYGAGFIVQGPAGNILAAGARILGVCDSGGYEQPFYIATNEVKQGRHFCSLTCRSNFRSKQNLPVASRTPVHFTCKECEVDFTMMESYVTAYRKKFGRDPLALFRRINHLTSSFHAKTLMSANKLACRNCGKTEQNP